MNSGQLTNLLAQGIRDKLPKTVLSGEFLIALMRRKAATGNDCIFGPQPYPEEFYKMLPVSSVPVCSVLIAWYFTRTVLEFDPDFEKELINTENNISPEPESFQKFFGNPVFVPIEKRVSDQTTFLGFINGFFHIRLKGKHLPVWVCIPFFRDDDKPDTCYLKDAWTLYPESNTFAEDRETPLIKQISDSLVIFDQQNLSDIKNEFLQKTAYLLSDMPEPTENFSCNTPKLSVVKRKKKTDTIFPPDRPRIVRLGEKFGNEIRDFIARGVPHGTVRPHIRRAHWHTVVFGKGRNQRKVLWMPPIFVRSSD